VCYSSESADVTVTGETRQAPRGLNENNRTLILDEQGGDGSKSGARRIRGRVGLKDGQRKGEDCHYRGARQKKRRWIKVS